MTDTLIKASCPRGNVNHSDHQARREPEGETRRDLKEKMFVPPVTSGNQEKLVELFDVALPAYGTKGVTNVTKRLSSKRKDVWDSNDALNYIRVALQKNRSLQDHGHIAQEGRRKGILANILNSQRITYQETRAKLAQRRSAPEPTCWTRGVRSKAENGKVTKKTCGNSAGNRSCTYQGKSARNDRGEDLTHRTR